MGPQYSIHCRLHIPESPTGTLCIFQPQSLVSSLNPLPANTSTAGTADKWDPALGHSSRLPSPTVSLLLDSRISISPPAFPDSEIFPQPLTFPGTTQFSFILLSMSETQTCFNSSFFRRQSVCKTAQPFKTSWAVPWSGRRKEMFACLVFVLVTQLLIRGQALSKFHMHYFMHCSSQLCE